jgi:predicted MFS family arabinose efflux permease
MVMLLNVILFMGITSRMVSSSALISAIPEPKDRGAFMSVNSAIQQISGGIASTAAGLIVIKTKSGFLDHYERLGYVVMASMVFTLFMMYQVNAYAQRQKLAKIQEESKV